MKVYRIRNWDTIGFEVAQNRRIQGPLPWIAIPTKQDGKGYRRLLRLERGPALYGAWIAIACVAAKAPVRGALVDSDGPLTAEDISLKTDFPEELIQWALDILVEKIAWMEQVEIDKLDQLSTACRPDVDAMPSPGTERNGTDVPSPSPGIPESGAGEAFGPPGVTAPKSDVNGRKQSIFRNLTPEILADSKRLRNWFDWQLKHPEGLVPAFASDEWGECQLVAKRALDGRKQNPAAWFARVAGGRNKHGSTNGKPA